MFNGKTKTGVDTGSTFGMKEPRKGPVWVLVADISGAKLFGKRPGHLSDWKRFPTQRVASRK